MSSVVEKLEKLKDIATEQQAYGTAKLAAINNTYDDGTIQGVNDNIPGLSTSEKVGVVKPDGETTTVDEDGTMHATAESGTTNYNELTSKPQINGVELSGNKSGSALGLTNYNNLSNKPQINGVELSGNKSAGDLGINVSVATTSKAGIVKPDGTSVTIDPDGTMHSIGSSGIDYSISAAAAGDDIVLTDSADSAVVDLTVYGKEGGAGANGLTVTATGKNLFNINGDVNKTHNRNGTEWYTIQADRKSTVENNILTTNTDVNTMWPAGQVIAVKPNTTYTFSAKVISFGNGTGANIRIDRLNIDGNGDYFDPNWVSTNTIGTRLTVTITTTMEAEVLTVIMGKNGTGAQFTDIQFEEGTIATNYEPYHNPTSISIATALPLRALPVSADGTYTDSGGQQWLADQITLSEKTATKRIGAYIFDSNASITIGVSDSRYVSFDLQSYNGVALNIADGLYAMPSDEYTYRDITQFYTDPVDKTYTLVGNQISIYDAAYLDNTKTATECIADFIAHMSGQAIVYKLAEETATALSAAELQAFRSFRTFEGTINITATDDPHMTIEYVKNTDNGKAAAKITDGLHITVSGVLTLTAAGWSNNAQTVAFAHDTRRRNVIDITPAEMLQWAECDVYAVSETAASITFNCTSVPSGALTFRVTSMEVGAV